MAAKPKSAEPEAKAGPQPANPDAKSDEAPPKKSRRSNKISDEMAAQKIKVLSRDEEGKIKNPKRAGGDPAKRFDLYTEGMLVSTALDKGVTPGDVHWDIGKGFIELA
jgi:hypothetical protein